jgi:hypothetical protein
MGVIGDTRDGNLEHDREGRAAGLSERFMPQVTRRARWRFAFSKQIKRASESDREMLWAPMSAA